MNDEQRQEIVRRLHQGEELSPEWARILFPPERRETELVYHGKEREEDIIANTLAVPLQKVRTFGTNGDGWHNKLIFGDNLQVMKSLLEMKKRVSFATPMVCQARDLSISIRRLQANRSLQGHRTKKPTRTRLRERHLLNSSESASF